MGTDTRTAVATLACETFGTALSTVVVVGLDGNTSPTAQRLAFGTDTFAAATTLACEALVATCTTVVFVGLCVDAWTVAQLSFWAKFGACA